MSSFTAAVRAELAPSGRLRAGVNHGNFLIVSGTRDGVPVGVAPDLGRELARAKGIDASYELFVSQGLEALGGLKPRLIQDVEKLPGARILDGRVTAVQQAIGTPLARQAGAKYLREFVEEAKASGFVARAIEKHSVRGVSVAPQAGAA